ncbi:MAG TPA: c-type cytochrome [Oleiagrimonas sp.]|nr:c-type cytochrome [Oleiagrimonas sp.]
MVWSGKCWQWAVMAMLGGCLLAGTARADKVPDTLQQRIAACTSCHGKHGQGGGDGFNPRLAGKPALYLYHQLLNFRDGRRHYPMMRHMVTGLPEAYLREIADYFAAQEPVWPQPEPSSLPQAVLQKGRNLVMHGDPARNVPACAACHGKRLTGLEPAIPPLVGLPAAYVTNQLGAWRGGTRHAMAPDCMAKVASRLTPQQITAVAAWLSSQPVPEDTRPAPVGSMRLPLKCGGMTP